MNETLKTKDRDVKIQNRNCKSQRLDSDRQPPVYKTGALPLSYVGRQTAFSVQRTAFSETYTLSAG